MSAYLGSTYVNRFNKFGLSLQVYVQADSQYRAHPEDVLKLYVKSMEDKMVPIGAIATLQPAVGAPIISLYNLYPSSAIVGSPAPGFSSGEAMDLMDQIADADPAARHQLRMDGDVLPGEHRRQSAPVSCSRWRSCWSISASPASTKAGSRRSASSSRCRLSLIGPAIALGSVGAANNLYTQIGLMLLIALSAKNAILIVEVAREARLLHGKPIIEAAVEAARTRLRPILMTSFAFILGVVPLVTATGAGANSRISLGLCVFSGMIASTCLAVLFVPSFFTVLQRFEERGKEGQGSAKQPFRRRLSGLSSDRAPACVAKFCARWLPFPGAPGT